MAGGQRRAEPGSFLTAADGNSQGAEAPRSRGSLQGTNIFNPVSRSSGTNIFNRFHEREAF